MRSGEMRSIAHMDDICKNDILCSILGLRQLQTRIYWLVARRGMEIPRIAQTVGRDRTSVQRAVQDLIACGLLSRKPLPTRRGRKYSYQGIGEKRLKARLRAELDSYCDRLRGEIDRIGEKQ